MEDILIPFVICGVIAFVVIGFILSDKADRKDAEEDKRKKREVEDYNASQTKEIIKYNDKYFIRWKQKHFHWHNWITNQVWYMSTFGHITVSARWTDEFKNALMFDTLEQAQAGLESLKIEYVSPNNAEVVYKEEKGDKKDTILELIDAVRQGDDKREIEILKSLGYGT
jgi:hypothetical protein